MNGMETVNSDVARAEEIKQSANDAFKAHKYSQAIDLYSQAIDLNGKNAVYWANRAFAHAKLEEYGSAIQDATQAIQVDPGYSKSYYRRGVAYLAMGKFMEALKDFQQVKKLCPNDPEAAKKLKECEKAVMKLRFEEAIAVHGSAKCSIAESINFHTIGWSLAFVLSRLTNWCILFAKGCLVVMGVLLQTTLSPWKNKYLLDLEVEPQYSGARIEGEVVTLKFIKKMMDDFKNEKLLHRRYAHQIVLQTRECLRAMPSLVDINVTKGNHFTVCGDVHGQFYDLLNIFELNGLPSEDNPYLFNGDFVDRGSFSLEVILTLFAFKCMAPSAIYLSRGNHETKNMNKIYGFEGEVKSKLSEAFVELFAEVFCCLPLAHVLNGKVFVVHGGLFSDDGVKLSDIKAIDRFCEPPEEGLMCELLWSDPQSMPGRGPSKRGVGLSFGEDVTKRFLRDNDLDLVVRSHEVKDEGYEIMHSGKLITVFSAPNYCDRMGNKGAFIKFQAPDMKPHIVTFTAVHISKSRKRKTAPKDGSGLEKGSEGGQPSSQPSLNVTATEVQTQIGTENLDAVVEPSGAKKPRLEEKVPTQGFCKDASWLRPDFVRPGDSEAVDALSEEISRVPKLKNLGTYGDQIPRIGLSFVDRITNFDSLSLIRGSSGPDIGSSFGYAISEVVTHYRAFMDMHAATDEHAEASDVLVSSLQTDLEASKAQVVIVEKDLETTRQKMEIMNKDLGDAKTELTRFKNLENTWADEKKAMDEKAASQKMEIEKLLKDKEELEALKLTEEKKKLILDEYKISPEFEMDVFSQAIIFMDQGAWNTMRVLQSRGLINLEPAQMADLMNVDACDEEFWPEHQRIPFAPEQIDLMTRFGLNFVAPTPDEDNAVLLLEKIRVDQEAKAALAEAGEENVDVSTSDYDSDTTNDISP